jgi:hypothetical protein
MAAFPRKHEPDFRESADESRPRICNPPKLAALRAAQYPHRPGSQAERPPRFLNEAMRPWADGGSPGVPACACCRPHWLCREATARRSARRVTLPSPRLTRNAVQLRKLFYQAGRAAAGLLVVVFAMTGAAKLADQIVTWLTFAVWQPFTIADALRFWGIPVPQAPQLLGLAQLTDAVLSWPGIPAYLVLAGACLFMFARIDRELGRLSRKSAGAHPQRPFDVIAGTSAVRRTTEVARK